MIPYSMPYGQSPLVPVYNAEEAQKMRELEIHNGARIHYEASHAIVELSKKQELSNIKLSESKEMSKQHADIASERELQKTKVVIGDDGRVSLCKEQFNSVIKGQLPISVLSAFRLAPVENKQNEWVLFVEIQMLNKKKASLYIHSSQVENRIIKKKFREIGVSFGFGDKKEMEIKNGLISQLISTVPFFTIPVKHGWYMENGELNYAFPEEKAWKEVMLCI